MSHIKVELGRVGILGLTVLVELDSVGRCDRGAGTQCDATTATIDVHFSQSSIVANVQVNVGHDWHEYAERRTQRHFETWKGDNVAATGHANA